MRLIFLLILTASLSAAVDSTQLKRYEKQLSTAGKQTDSLTQEIAAQRKQIDSLNAREGDQLSLLNSMEEELSLSRSFLDLLEGRLDSLHQQGTALASSVDTLDHQLQRRRKLLIQRIMTMHRQGTPSFLEVLLGSTTPDEALKRVHYTKAITATDIDLIATFKRTQSQLALEQQLLARQELEADSLKQAQQEKLATLEQQQQERKSLLNDIRSERSSWESALREMEQAQKELTALMGSIEREKSAIAEKIEKLGKSIEPRKGSLPWPARGRLLARFGKVENKQYKTVIHNKGIDIAAKRGAAVTLVGDGVVSYVGTMRGYGKLVLVEHSDNYSTIYAHLGSVSVAKGDELKGGATVGTVGESGSIEGVKLHFEIRKKATALDPEEWLTPLQS